VEELDIDFAKYQAALREIQMLSLSPQVFIAYASAVALPVGFGFGRTLRPEAYKWLTPELGIGICV
jgi:hypothetical protein